MSFQSSTQARADKETKWKCLKPSRALTYPTPLQELPMSLWMYSSQWCLSALMTRIDMRIVAWIWQCRTSCTRRYRQNLTQLLWNCMFKKQATKSYRRPGFSWSDQSAAARSTWKISKYFTAWRREQYPAVSPRSESPANKRLRAQIQKIRPDCQGNSIRPFVTA